MNEIETNIEHLKKVVQAVFKAEHEVIARGWRDRLEKAKELPQAEKEAEADAYIEAVAVEILKNQNKIGGSDDERN